MKQKPVTVLIILCLSMFITIDCKKKLPTSSGGDTLITYSGFVNVAGQAFTDVDIYLSRDASHKEVTGAEGKFTFSNIEQGNYIVTPSRPGYRFEPSHYEVGSESRSDLNFEAFNATFGTDVHDIAVNFTAFDQNRNSVSLSDYHGNVILVDFTADWCGPCREKAETAESFYQEHKNKGFVYILIVIEGNPAVWADTYGLTFHVLDDNNQKIYNQYRKTDIPLPHVLDRNLTIRYKKMGWNKNEVEEEINKYL